LVCWLAPSDVQPTAGPYLLNRPVDDLLNLYPIAVHLVETKDLVTVSTDRASFHATSSEPNEMLTDTQKMS